MVEQPALQRMAQNTAAHRPRGTSSVSGHFVGVKRQHSQTAVKQDGHSGSGRLRLFQLGLADMLAEVAAAVLEWVGNGTQRFSGFPTFSIVKPKDGKQMRHYLSHKAGLYFRRPV